MSDPHAPQDVGVTIKVPESKRYAADNPWFVFRGSPSAVKAMIAETFGIEHEGLDLASVTINAQRLASNLGTISHSLGASVISNGSQEATSPASQPAQGGDDVWAQAAAAKTGQPPWNEEQPAADPILAALELATTVQEVQQVWAENQDAFNSNESYMEAYKAKGRALMGN